jgi:hypothetical protein
MHIIDTGKLGSSPEMLRNGRYLFSHLLNVNNFGIPIAEVGSHELINCWQKLFSDHGGADEG